MNLFRKHGCHAEFRGKWRCWAVFALAAFFVLGVCMPVTLRAEEAAAENAEAEDVAAENLAPVKEAETQDAWKAAGAASLRGLKWLAAHQEENGSWSFDHGKAPQCQGKCGNPGTAESARVTATAVALIPFLDWEITHRRENSPYRETVQRGLAFLQSRGEKSEVKIGKDKKKVLRFSDGEFGMTTHALATLCLVDAYRQTRDQTLREPAQQAVDFILYAQDPAGGGWGVRPRTPGNLTVSAWQITALSDAYMAYLSVPAAETKMALAFMDSLRVKESGMYRMMPGRTPDDGATAAALWCGVRYHNVREDRIARAGYRWLESRGMSETDQLFNFYAVMAFRGVDMREQEKTARRMRDAWKVRTQCTDESSHEYGSWYFPDADHPGAKEGGRLLQTALMTMIPDFPHTPSPLINHRKAN